MEGLKAPPKVAESVHPLRGHFQPWLCRHISLFVYSVNSKNSDRILLIHRFSLPCKPLGVLLFGCISKAAYTHARVSRVRGSGYPGTQVGSPNSSAPYIQGVLTYAYQGIAAHRLVGWELASHGRLSSGYLYARFGSEEVPIRGSQLTWLYLRAHLHVAWGHSVQERGRRSWRRQCAETPLAETCQAGRRRGEWAGRQAGRQA